MKSIFNFITGTVLTTVVYFLGGLDVALKTLLVFILLDYVTGVCEAITNKRLNSIIGAKGIIKKIGYLIIVALAVQLDTITGETGAIRTLVIYFFVANEGISILEYTIENGITPEELDFKLFVLSLFWPILIIYIIVVYGGRK